MRLSVIRSTRFAYLGWLVVIVVTMAAFVGPNVFQVSSAQNGVKFDPCGRETFFHATMQKDEIGQDFTDAVLRITAGDKTGTGYVIDSARGYVLTAFHVVDEAYGKKTPPPIEATNPALGKAVLHLTIKDHLSEPEDTALLLADSAGLADLKKNNIPSLDIALNLPSGNFFTLGYPLGKQNTDFQGVEILDTNYTDSAHGNGNYLEVKQSVDEGSSGSPLIDENGAVIATLVSNLNISLALYTPLVDIQKLLRDIPIDKQAISLDEEVIGSRPPGSATQHLIDELKWKPRNPSNVELYEWSSKIIESLKDTKNADYFRPYLACPIIQAYSERRLTEAPAIREIAEVGPQEAQSIVERDSINQSLVRHKFEVARVDADRAVNTFTFNGTAGSFSALLGRADLYTQRYEDANKAFSYALKEAPNDSEKAKIEVNSAEAYLKLGDPDKAYRFAQHAMPTLHNNGDAHDEVLAYETLGQAAVAKGDYLQARNNLEQARQMSQNTVDTSRQTVLLDTELRQVADRELEARRSDERRSIMLALALSGLFVAYLFGASFTGISFSSWATLHRTVLAACAAGAVATLSRLVFVKPFVTLAIFGGLFIAFYFANFLHFLPSRKAFHKGS